MRSYDYIIIGAGAAGLMLADALGCDPFFKDKTILVLDKEAKQTNDRTWCFWEKDPSSFDAILHKKWDQINFIGQEINKTYTIAPYAYKMIQGLDFYQHYLKRIDHYPNITMRQEEVVKIEATLGKSSVFTSQNKYCATQIFNSIYAYKEPLTQTKYPVLQQHFIGWFIQTDTPVFKEKVATFMDFSIPQKGNTRFMYVLPFSATEALVEYTLFSEQLLENETYEKAIQKYLKENLGLVNYQITAREKGSIPMTCYPFSKKNTASMLYIGTAGGWTKASTGYTFKNTSKKVKDLILHLKKEKPLPSFHKRNKFWFYDLLLLDILFKHNELGPSIFESLFKNRSPQLIFKFLDEETNLWEDIQFISSLSPMPFIKAVLHRVFKP